MKIPQILTLIHENPSDSYVDPSDSYVDPPNRLEFAYWSIKENPLK